MPLVAAIRVLLALDGIAADLLERRLAGDDDFELVRTQPALALETARELAPDFLVVSLAADHERRVCELLLAESRIKILALESGAGHAFLTEFVADVSPDDLAEVLRRAAVDSRRA